MVKISERLRTAAGLIGEGERLADVGTDLGYVPIYLVERKRIPSAIAMDIRTGPLERAREHIRMYGMEDYIQTRLSDGVAALKPGEADTILIAGMGGGLVKHILESGRVICEQAHGLVLQPQSELPKVRRFLMENGYVTEREEMVMEDGKYYPMMRVHFDASAVSHADSFTEEQELEFRYGKQLLTEKHPVLLAYLRWEVQIQQDILTQLSGQPATEQIAARIDDVKQILAQNARALAYYE